MSKEELFEIHIIPTFKLFHSIETTWGIYKAILNEDSPNADKIMNDFGDREISIVGSMPELDDSKTYIASVIEVYHKKYGKQYEVKTIYEKPYVKREDQVRFLSSLLTQFQLESLCKAYPEDNIVELIKNDKVDLSLVKGIGEVRIKEIKKKILEGEKYQKAILELGTKFDIDYKIIKRLSDRYGSPELLLQKINENPYLLTEVEGYGFKKVDEIALKMGVEKTSTNRIISCLKYLLNEEANNGHCWMPLKRIISDSAKLLEIRISNIDKVIDLIKSDENSGVIVLENRIFLEKYYVYEILIYSNIIRLLNSETSYNIPNIEEKIKEIENEQGFEFTDEQRKAIFMAVDSNIVAISGRAGSGKTSVIKGILGVLKSIDGLEYATCAMSGKASQRIKESTGFDSYTIHRLLGYNPNLGWAFNEENRMGYDIVVLDEASMVNSQLFYYLIRAVKDGAKLIISGDVSQLEAIGVGKVFSDLLESKNVVPSVELTKVHRQAQQSGILSCANTVRDGLSFTKSNDYKNKRLGELKDFYFYPFENKDNILDSVMSISRKYKNSGGDIMEFQVLTPMKTRGELSTFNINRILQKIFNQDPEHVDENKKIKRKVGKNEMSFLEGDKVIINGNNYELGVFNGTMGIIEHIGQGEKGLEIVIDFEGTGRLLFTKKMMKDIDLAYAITTHKSQGSQWDNVVFTFDYSSYMLLNRQATYTGMTRAKKYLFMPVELKALLYSIKVDSSSNRNTFLKNMLTNAK